MTTQAEEIPEDIRRKVNTIMMMIDKRQAIEEALLAERKRCAALVVREFKALPPAVTHMEKIAHVCTAQICEFVIRAIEEGRLP